MYVYIFTGVSGYVHRYFAAFCAIFASTFISVPCAVCLMSFFLPCMPPVLTSTIILKCEDWSHDGEAGLVIKFVMGMYEIYA